MVNAEQSESDVEELEGLDPDAGSWGDYPIDNLLIRNENRTVYDVNRRMNKNNFILDPDFQRDFIWPKDKQSKLIESVIMRIPLPVFYLAEDTEGRMIVVDGLQRLSTFRSFLDDKLELILPDRKMLHKKRFSELPPKLQNRVEDLNLIFYVIDSKAPERARLDIFERVNSGIPLTRQQMRNSLYMGKATLFLRDEVKTDIFKSATGGSLSWKKMRDREFVNRFCGFKILDLNEYKGDMDEFLAECLRKMNGFSDDKLASLSNEFRTGLSNNFLLFDQHAFRRHKRNQKQRTVLNASFWDVMSTGLSNYNEAVIEKFKDEIRDAVYELLKDEGFITSIRYGPNDAKKVRHRFEVTQKKFFEILGQPNEFAPNYRGETML